VGHRACNGKASTASRKMPEVGASEGRAKSSGLPAGLDSMWCNRPI